MQAMILSLVRSTLITAGTAFAIKKGVDPSVVESLVAPFIVLVAAVWGAWSGLKKPQQ